VVFLPPDSAHNRSQYWGILMKRAYDTVLVMRKKMFIKSMKLK
jgi:hypothetical protein